MNQSYDRAIRIFGLLVSALGTAVAGGWIFHVEVLKKPLPGLPAMSMHEALTFILSGIVLVFFSLKKNNPHRLSAAIATGSVFIIASGVFYFSETTVSSFSFMLLGIAYLFSNYNSAFLKAAANYISIFIFITGLYYLFIPIYYVPELKSTLSAYPMAVHTALCFQIATFGLMFVNTDYAFMRGISVFVRVGGLSRFLFPAAVFFPFIIGIILLHVWLRAEMSLELLILLGTSLVMLVFFCVTVFISFELKKMYAKNDAWETELLKKNEELALSNERFFRFFKSSPVPTNIINIKTGRILHANEAFLNLFKFTKEQAVGKTTVELKMVSSEQRERIVAKIKQHHYELQNVDVVLLDSEGIPKSILSSIHRIDINGEPHMLNTLVDITERKLFEEQLQEKNRELDLKNKELEQYAFIASHDLQEPLRTISSFTDLLNEEYAARFDENANTYLRFISQSAERMRDLINGLLDYSRLGNKMVLQPTDCNLVLDNALKNLHTAIKQNGAKINAGNLPLLPAYPVELELLFQNLISNAIKFRKKEGRPEITVSAVKKENEWQFAVKDNGIGIEQKYFEKIFQLFQRLHSRNSYEGSGIGLAHCQKIVELHKGKIWLESSPGRGTTFYFTVAEN